MRVGVVTHYMPPHTGGIERVAASLSHGYRQHGLDVRWVASRVPSASPARDGTLVRVGCWNAPERWLGIPVPIWGWEGWREVDTLARWADVLHVHDCLYAGSAWAVALGRRHRKPVILSQHVGPVGYRNIVLKLLERGAYATLGRAVLVRATHLVYATPAAETFVPALLGYRPPRACSIPNGIDFSLFDPPSRARRMAARTRLGLPLDARIVLFAGRLVEKKGLPIVLEVSRRSPGVHFLVIGDGPLSTLLEGLGPHVTWLPTVEHARMADYYHGADCLLLPSRGEGLPLVVQEAMACGLPLVVTADEAYARELAAAEACVAVAPSADQVTAAMNRVLVDTPADLAERQRRYAESRWEVTDMVRRYVALIQEVGRHLHRVPS